MLEPRRRGQAWGFHGLREEKPQSLDHCCELKHSYNLVHLSIARWQKKRVPEEPVLSLVKTRWWEPSALG